MPPRAMKATKRDDTSIRASPNFISSLPDQILHQILGFLNTKEAVQTCVLSKRWEHLWTSLPSLHFDPNDFIQRNQLKGLQGDEYETEIQACYERYVTFVNEVLFRREPLDLDVFHSSCEPFHWEDEQQAMEWIDYAVKHHTRVFHLRNFDSLPSCLYNCASIEELDLVRCEVHDSVSLNLPKLRKLYICSNEANPFPKNLLSGCPMLECLALNLFLLDDEIVIAHEYLKHLCFMNCSMRHMLIDAPNLLSFSFDSYFPWYVPPPREAILNVPSLMSVDIETDCFEVSTRSEAMSTLLGALSNTEILNLHINCDELMEVKKHAPDVQVTSQELHGVQLRQLPIFHKLTDVVVAFRAPACLNMVAWILNSSPNLKKLTLVVERACYPDEIGATTSVPIDVSLMVAIILCKKLEIIEVKYEERCDQIAGQLMDALIDATKELENLKINSSKYKSLRECFKVFFVI